LTKCSIGIKGVRGEGSTSKPVITFLTWDDEHHRFALVNLDALDPDGVDPGVRSSVGVNHVAYTYDSVGDLLDTYSRLKERGVMPYWRVHHGLTLSLYYSDPDGNRMEFQVDCFDTMEESNAFIRGEIMAANPIGVAFDPTTCCNGTSTVSLSRRCSSDPTARSPRFRLRDCESLPALGGFIPHHSDR
jgi:hypothetical protein